MRAALLTAHNSPLTLADVEPVGPLLGQVRVRVLTAGICGAQLQEIRGEKGGPLPHLMGHEGCGIVEEAGEGVTRVKAGDKVVLHWRKAEGIESDFPRYLYAGHEITSGRVTTFAERVIVSENRCTRVEPHLPADAGALLGCGLSTALAVVENDTALRYGESVLVVGCGGLGLNLILAARLRGAGYIAATDVWDKFDQAAGAGVDWFGTQSPGKARYDVILDTTGLGLWMQALAPSGRYVFVGQPKPNAAVVLNEALHLFEGEGKVIRATQGGGFVPHRDLPRYAAMVTQHRIDVAKVITHRVKLENINDGLALVADGKAGRVMVEI